MAAAGKPAAGALPRITILTPSRNAARYIADAVENLRRQDYPDLEHIVLDAASTDGTLEILAGFPGSRVVSEPDRGSHDAMNKGLALAGGEIIGFLNVDDLYPEGLLAEVARRFAANPELDVLVGGTTVFEDSAGGARRIVVARDHSEEDGFSLPELAFGAPGFNGRFFRRWVFERIGNFNNGYYISGDRHFLLRIALAGLKTGHLRRTALFYRLHAGSQTINAQRRLSSAIIEEHVRMAREFVDATRRDSSRHRVLATWEAFETVKLGLDALRDGRILEALRTYLALSLRMPLWPVRLIQALALRRAVRASDRTGAAASREVLP